MRAYLLLGGFIVFLIGLVVAWSSINMLDGAAPLSAAAIRLFEGGLLAVIGGVTFLMAFLSHTSKHSYVYY